MLRVIPEFGVVGGSCNWLRLQFSRANADKVTIPAPGTRLLCMNFLLSVVAPGREMIIELLCS